MSSFKVLRLTDICADFIMKNEIQNVYVCLFFLYTSSRIGRIFCLMINHCICLANYTFLSVFVNLSHLILIVPGEVGQAKDILPYEQMRWLGLLGRVLSKVTQVISNSLAGIQVSWLCVSSPKCLLHWCPKTATKMYTMKFSTNVDWLIWLKIIKDLFSVISIVSVKEFKCTLSPVAGAQERDRKQTMESFWKFVSSKA